MLCKELFYSVLFLVIVLFMFLSWRKLKYLGDIKSKYGKLGIGNC